LEPERRGRVVHTSYVEALRFRADDGSAHWLYVVDEYGMSASPPVTTAPAPVLECWRRRACGPEACPPRSVVRSYAMLVSEDELFWVVGARDADEGAPDAGRPRASLDSVPFMDAIYWSAYRRGRLRERDGQRCRVYAVEERSAGRGRRVPARYGIRFLDDHSYWVVPAREVVIAPTYCP
jgi:hypothetical protein